MSDGWWIKSLLGGLGILIFGIASSKGNFDECSLCCTLQGLREDLNCTWMNDSSLQLNVLLQSITNSHDVPQHYTIPPGQKWLLIHRKSLTLYHQYQLSVNGGTWMETLNLTYCHGCENVFIGAPELHSSSYEEEGRLAVEVTWKPIKEYSQPPVVELRYRIHGDNDWILVNSTDLQPDCYELTDLEPYTDYEFQIRIVPDEQQKSRGLWSDIHVVSTPEEVPIGAPDIWRRMDQENSTLVIWKALSRHSARGKILSYNVTYTYNNVRQTTEEPCCNVKLPAQSTHVCVSARNSMGLGPHSCISPLCSVAPDMGDFSGKSWGDPTGRIAVWWNESMTYGFLGNYLVEWRKDNNISEMDWVRSQAVNQTIELQGTFSPGVPYNISIHALYNDSCVIIFSTEAYGREEAPLEAPIYSIRELSSTKVFISWKEIPRHKLRGKLKHYTIYINSTTRSVSHTVHDRHMTLSSLSPQTCYDIYITASTAAGEGVASASHRFCTKEGMRNLHPLVLPLVSLSVVCVLILAVLRSLCDLWPKIPKPGDKFNSTAISAKFWELQQTPPNPPITEVEEVEQMSPPSPPPPPNQSRAISSGYEKHFMPTPEEVMGLC